MAKKNKKHRFNLIKFLLFAIALYIVGFGVYQLTMMPIKHIRILNTTYLSDQSILREAKIDNYPSFLLTTSFSIKKNLSKNAYIKGIKVSKKWFCRLDIYIEEYKALFYNAMGQLVLENKALISDKSSIDAPKLINTVTDTIYGEFVQKMLEVDDNVLLKISEIEYKPNDVDKERFLLTMNDGNYVYLTLYTFSKINNYDEILATLENKNGILYLDSGNYFEIID
ncbi:MAG: FtsQ-type POTRA domain-containing protein [Bacilli bacterium]|jgi:cell division septal protein FtsQ